MIQSLFWHAYAAFLAIPAHAQINPPGATSTPTVPPGATDTSVTLFNPLGDKSVQDLLALVLSTLTLLAIPIVTIMVIIGAYYIITSGGNPGKRTTGKNYILWAAVGFAILLLADSVVAILTDFITS